MTEDIRPTSQWRARKKQEAEDLAAGRIGSDECFMAELFPDEFIDRTEPVLDAYAAAIALLPAEPGSYPSVMACIKEAVEALNEIAAVGEGGWIETNEREELCEFIDQVLVRHGFDIDDLARSQGVGRHELTDGWRDW